MPETEPKPRPSSALDRARTTRRERHKAEVRDRLIRAAIKLFATRGFTATTVEDITQSADVAKGTFFNYFSTKELLLADLIERRIEILREARQQAREGQIPFRTVLRRLLRSLMAEPGRSPSMARCVLLAALGGGPVENVVQQILTQSHEILTEMMTIGQRQGEIRGDWPAHELGRLFQQSFYGVLYLQALDPNLNLSRSLDATFALFWAGANARLEHSRKPAKRAL